MNDTVDIIDLCWDVFPWISNHATLLGLETQDKRFAQLGGELFILTQQVSFSSQTGAQSKLVKIAELVNKACSVSDLPGVDQNWPLEITHRLGFDNQTWHGTWAV